MGAAREGHVAQAQVVEQLSPEVVLLLALALHRLQRLLQLTLGDVLQTHGVLELALQDLRLLLQDLELVLQALKLHLEEQQERGEEPVEEPVEQVRTWFCLRVDTSFWSEMFSSSSSA